MPYYSPALGHPLSKPWEESSMASIYSYYKEAGPPWGGGWAFSKEFRSYAKL